MKISELAFPSRLPESRGEAPAAARPAGAPASWEQGGLLQGRVVSSAPDGRVVLELAGERVSARSSVPLTPGREFWFEVRQGGSEPHLALADKKGAMYRFLQQASGGFTDLARLGQLAPLFKGFGGPPAEAADQLARLALAATPAPEKLMQLASWLRSGGHAAQAGQGGSNWSWPGSGGAAAQTPPAVLPEQLQAMLAALRQSMPPGPDQELLAAVTRVSGVLEAMAGMNEQPPPANQAPFWLLPCFFALGAGAGSWLFSREEQQEEDGQALLTLAFFLEMSHLGELQLQIRTRGERLEGDFFLADAEAAEFMRGQLADLRLRLENLGYQADFRCHVSAAPLLPALKEALEKTVGGEARRLIDIRA